MGNGHVEWGVLPIHALRGRGCRAARDRLWYDTQVRYKQVGGQGVRNMHDPFQWSIGLGRWCGLTVRLHVLFLAFAAATLYLFWPEDVSGPEREASRYLMAAGQMLGTVAAAIAVLFCSVLVHELSHWWAARRAGTAPDAIVIGPLGGLTPWPSAASPHQELAIWSAGPLANLFLWALLATVVMVRNPDHSLAGLFNPLQPGGLAVGTSRVMQLVAIASWINSLLFLVNSLPGYPFDGGRMLRSALRWTCDGLRR
jgi:Zn-dependent protease